MINFGTAQRYISVTHYTRRPARWQQSVTNIPDTGTVQIVLPNSSSIVPGNFKVKVRFFNTANHEVKDIAYFISPSGLMTLYLPVADSTTTPLFSGHIFFTQRN
jgi:hypothetical protein